MLRLTLQPNPARSALRAEVTLSDPFPARISVLDLAGRIVVERRLAEGPGSRSVELGRAALAPGVYFVRLTQGARSITARAAILE
jgi:hypothetical protein